MATTSSSTPTEPRPSCPPLPVSFGPGGGPARLRAALSQHTGQLALARLPYRPCCRKRGEQCVDLAPLDAPLVDELPGGVVLLEHRLAGLKHEEETARRIDQRDPAVEREVQLRILFVSRAP